MIDALMYAARDQIRSAGLNFGQAECEIMDDGRPPPRCGNVFVSIHSGRDRSTDDNNLMEYYEFTVSLTMRVIAPLDRVGDQQIYRNLPRDMKEGFRAKVDSLRRILHMNWAMVVLPNQIPKSANDNLVNWTTGFVYGFIEPVRYTGASDPRLVGGEWFNAQEDEDAMGIVSDLSFEGARRMQPQTAAIGPFV